jgi:hypothetical protein
VGCAFLYPLQTLYNSNNQLIMKKALLFLGLLSSAAQAQNCSKIFISEYVEGYSNNKALEIYNPTASPINLGEYFVARYSNGSNTATIQNSVQLSGTVQPYDVFVAVIDQRNPAGTGQDAPIWDSLEARADGFFSPVYETSDAFYWNGNDAVMLAKGNLSGLSANTQITPSIPGFAIMDIFGKIGENPGPNTGWSTVAPYNNGLGEVITKDHSMIRKPTVLQGVTAPVAAFNGLAEYDTIPDEVYLIGNNGDTIRNNNGTPRRFGNWFSLGEHDCNCSPALGVKGNEQAQMVVYPNPVTNGVAYIKGAENVKEVQVINALGQTVAIQSNNSGAVMSVKLGADRGVYILRIVEADGSVTSKRIVVK